MTDAELLDACKTGLNISQSTTALDGILNQKLKAVKSYMKSAGVSDTTLENDLAVGVIVMGVGDIWELKGGESKFSAAFHSLLTQLTYTSYASINAFSVTYDGNGNTGGGVPLDNSVYLQNENITVFGNIGELTKTGYSFESWNTADDGSGSDYKGNDTFSVGVTSKTLYAKWVVE